MWLFKTLVPAVVIACSSFAASAADVHAVVTPLMTKALPEFPGKEAHMITVEYPPGAVDPVHRHDAHVVGRNASKTEPAKFLVVFIKKTGAPILTVE